MKKIDELLRQKENLKGEVRTLMGENKIDEAESKMAEVRMLDKQIALEQELDEEEEREVEQELETRKNNEKGGDNMDKNLEYRAISKYLSGKELTQEERTSVNVGNSGAILPEGFVNQVEVLRKGFPSLKQYCHVIPVKTNTGKMPISEGVTNRKLAKLSTDTEMVKEMITTKPIEYAVEDYGKIIPVENSVLEDAGVDFYNSVLAPEFAECEVGSENDEIITLLKANKTEFEGTDYKAIAKCINTKVVPSLQAGLVIITNQDGYDYLDQLVDGNGRPALSDSLAVEGGKTYKGKEVIVLANEDLPNNSDKVPFYIVNLRALVKFFDRKEIEVAKSTEAGFTLNQTFVRLVKRFDVVKGDTRACFLVEITPVA
ncbi:phage major capsid protein [Clostridium perfringens]|uniref:phage major capsid protein n=1 Tax=Clostridium perfringens TaxID=1502 RepID=UPI0018E4D3E3|nr:phage major capsid protein [Clostridium perfringens]MBI6053003.1 phage major capsid protein [Clostridium perfringens]